MSVRTISTTIHGTEVVIASAHRFNRPILITSSSEVYGKGTRVPFSEDETSSWAPRASRAGVTYSKGIDEFLGLAYHKQFNLPWSSSGFHHRRPAAGGMLGWSFRVSCSRRWRQAAGIYGDGMQTRASSATGATSPPPLPGSSASRRRWGRVQPRQRPGNLHQRPGEARHRPGRVQEHHRAHLL